MLCSLACGGPSGDSSSRLSLRQGSTLLNTVPTHITHDETQRVATKPDFHQHSVSVNICVKVKIYFWTSGMRSTKRIKCGEDLALNDSEKN